MSLGIVNDPYEEIVRDLDDRAAHREHVDYIRNGATSMRMSTSTTDRLRARADRLEEEARGLRRLAKDLDFQEKNAEDGGFRFTDESKATLWRLAKL